MKLFLALSILLVSAAGQASSLEQLFPTKERVRLTLWFEGLELKQGQPEVKKAPNKSLPEELERALRTF